MAGKKVARRVAVSPHTLLEAWWYQHLHRGRLPLNRGAANITPIDFLLFDLDLFVRRHGLPPGSRFPSDRAVKLFLKCACPGVRFTRDYLVVLPSLATCRKFFVNAEGGVPKNDWRPAFELGGNVIELPVNIGWGGAQ